MGVLGFLGNFGGGGEGFEIGDMDWKLEHLIARGLRDLEECEAAAESITAHKAASSRSLSSAKE